MLRIAITLGCFLISMSAYAEVEQPVTRSLSGFEQIRIMGVVPTESGHTVLLANTESGRFIPMGVGAAEAISIHMRLEEKRFDRPLTHDLLESMMHQMGGELVRVQVDSLKDGIFFGTLVVKRKGKLLRIDARPSDAIALALGAKKPIFVEHRVFAEASIDLMADAASLENEVPKKIEDARKHEAKSSVNPTVDL